MQFCLYFVVYFLVKISDRPKHDQLMKAMDKLNEKHDRYKVVTAADKGEFFQMNRQHLSGKPTTDWGQIIRVKSG